MWCALLLVLCLLLPTPLLAASITLSWDFPAPPPDLAGFRIYYGPKSRGTILAPTRALTPVAGGPQAGVLRLGPSAAPYDAWLAVPVLPPPAPMPLQASVPGLTPGRRVYLSVTAHDGVGNESVFSNEVAFDIPLPPDTEPPAAPAQVRVTLVVDDAGRILITIDPAARRP